MNSYKIKDTQGIIRKAYKHISSVSYVIFGAAVGILPRFIVCPWTPENGFMPCWETAKLMSLFGMVFVFAGVFKTLIKRSGIKTWVDVSVMATALVGILVPAKIAVGCMNMGMACHTVAFPVIYCLMFCIGITAFIGSIGNIFCNYHSKTPQQLDLVQKY